MSHEIAVVRVINPTISIQATTNRTLSIAANNRHAKRLASRLFAAIISIIFFILDLFLISIMILPSIYVRIRFSRLGATVLLAAAAGRLQPV